MNSNAKKVVCFEDGKVILEQFVVAHEAICERERDRERRRALTVKKLFNDLLESIELLLESFRPVVE